MPIYIGNTKIKVDGVGKVYVGSQLVYQSGAAVLDYIVLSGQTTSLNRNSAFSFGGTVTAYYTDGTTADVTADTTFSGYNMSVAGTYTVTASYTEDSITKTATYTLTVNKIWEQLWSGSKSITYSSTNQSSPPADVTVATLKNLPATADMRVTFSASGQLWYSSGYQVRYKGWNSSWSTSKPSSPARNQSFNTTANFNYIIAVCQYYSSSSVPRAMSYVDLRYTASNGKFFLHAYYDSGGSYLSGKTMKITVTKIEIYR